MDVTHDLLILYAKYFALKERVDEIMTLDLYVTLNIVPHEREIDTYLL